MRRRVFKADLPECVHGVPRAFCSECDWEEDTETLEGLEALCRTTMNEKVTKVGWRGPYRTRCGCEAFVEFWAGPFIYAAECDKCGATW